MEIVQTMNSDPGLAVGETREGSRQYTELLGGRARVRLKYEMGRAMGGALYSGGGVKAILWGGEDVRSSVRVGEWGPKTIRGFCHPPGLVLSHGIHFLAL